MNYLKNIKLLYASKFFHNLIFAYVIERLFWQQRGMTIQMVVYAEIIYCTTILLLEIPTGILADKWSRKNLIVIGAFFTFLEFIIIIFANTFWHFGCAVFVGGISTSLVSGSENALLYDSLKHHNEESSFEKVLGRLKAFDFSAIIIAGLCGGFLATRFSLEFNYWLSLISVIIAFFITLFLKETTLHTQNTEKTSTISYIKNSFAFFRKNSNIALVLSTGIVLAACMNYIDEFWQLYLSELSIPVAYFGIFAAAISIAVIPGSLLTHRLKRLLGYRRLLIVLISSFTVMLFIIAFCRGYMGMLAIVMIGLLVGIVEPLVSGYLHHRISSHMRATIDSFGSLAESIASILIGLIFGYISTKISIFSGYAAIGIACAIYMIFFIGSIRKLEV